MPRRRLKSDDPDDRPADPPLRSAAGLVIGLAVVAGLLALIVGAAWAVYLLRGQPAARAKASAVRDAPAQVRPAGDGRAHEAGGAPADAPPAQVVGLVVDPAELCRAFRADPAKAEGEYRGKVVELTAAVGKPTGLNPGARPFAVLAAGGRDILSAFFVDNEGERVAALRKGQAVRVRGTVSKAAIDRADSSVTVTLEGCELLDGPPAGPPKGPANPPD